MAEHQRQHGPGRRRGPRVHEEDPETADARAEPRQTRELRLPGRAVELVRPVGHQLAQVVEVCSEDQPASSGASGHEMRLGHTGARQVRVYAELTTGWMVQSSRMPSLLLESLNDLRRQNALRATP
jgi:hypothetical protein